MLYLITKWFGTFLHDGEKIKKQIVFPKDEEEIVKRLIKIDRGEILPEEWDICRDVTDDVIVNERRLQKIGMFSPSNLFFKKLDVDPNSFGFSIDLLNRVSCLLAEKKTRERLMAEDIQIIQMVNALDDLIQTCNLFSERLNHWSLVSTSEEKISSFRNIFDSVKKEINRLEKQIEEDMKRIAPNISRVVGPLIGARLIALSGSLEHLATLPSSTIQILGAEKALFKFKKDGGKPPKHGIIFQHPLIYRSPKAKRGKIARKLAAKISIAAKADFFTKKDISDLLIADLNRQIGVIKNQ